jgi:hypothetical protein
MLKILNLSSFCDHINIIREFFSAVYGEKGATFDCFWHEFGHVISNLIPHLLFNKLYKDINYTSNLELFKDKFIFMPSLLNYKRKIEYKGIEKLIVGYAESVNNNNEYSKKDEILFNDIIFHLSGPILASLFLNGINSWIKDPGFSFDTVDLINLINEYFYENDFNSENLKIYKENNKIIKEILNSIKNENNNLNNTIYSDYYKIIKDSVINIYNYNPINNFDIKLKNELKNKLKNNFNKYIEIISTLIAYLSIEIIKGFREKNIIKIIEGISNEYSDYILNIPAINEYEFLIFFLEKYKKYNILDRLYINNILENYNNFNPYNDLNSNKLFIKKNFYVENYENIKTAHKNLPPGTFFTENWLEYYLNLLFTFKN